LPPMKCPIERMRNLPRRGWMALTPFLTCIY
jgi:hypothetical protein